MSNSSTLADDLDIAALLEEPGQPRAEEGVVIGKQHPNRYAGSSVCRPVE
jgi:hypothetical protein